MFKYVVLVGSFGLLHAGDARPDANFQSAHSTACEKLAETIASALNDQSSEAKHYIPQVLEEGKTKQGVPPVWAQHVEQQIYKCLAKGKGTPQERKEWARKGVCFSQYLSTMRGLHKRVASDDLNPAFWQPSLAHEYAAAVKTLKYCTAPEVWDWHRELGVKDV